MLSQLTKNNNLNPTVFMCDEYHEYVTVSDADGAVVANFESAGANASDSAEFLAAKDAEYVVVAYGIAARVAKEAINTLREEGYKVGMIRPITLYPFPKASLDNLDYSKVKGIIDVEMTIPAQMRDDIELQVKGRCPVHEYGRSGGMLLDDEGVYEAISNIVKGGE